ncbi:MAG: sterol desaturase family protein [Aquisalinus sp.]|nr:sterol desaturase family protein [Aquisalinus sp.]
MFGDGNFWTTYAFLTAIIIARYFMIAGFFHYYLWLRPAEKVKATRLTRHEPTKATIRHEIIMSTISAFIYAAPAAWVMVMWENGGTALYTEVDGILGWLYIPISILIFLFANDAFFYWTHRAMHHPRLYNLMHRTHHKSKQPTPWAAFSFHPTEALLESWLLPVMAIFIPIHVGAALFVLMAMTVTSVTNHAGWEILPRSWVKGWIGDNIISATHHNMHHTKFNGNYGLHFRLWDKLMGTDIMEPVKK